MQITLFSGLYPDFIGKRSMFAGVGIGPASYTTGTGDPVTVNVNPFYIDSLQGVMDTTGTYMVNFYSKASGVRQAWYARYSLVSSGAEYAGGAALKGLVFNGVNGIGGQF